MRVKNKYFSKWLNLAVVMAMLMNGCSAKVIKSKNFDASMRKIQRIAVAPMEIKMFRLEVGGTTEIVDEWMDTARESVASSLTEHFGRDQNIQLYFLSEDDLNQFSETDWSRYKSLYEAVLSSAMLHGFGEAKFNHKIQDFDYALGSNYAEWLEELEVDAMLFVYGSNFIETSGRKVAKAINFAAAVALAATVGVGVGLYAGGSGPNILTFGLVDRDNGQLIWLRRTGTTKSFNLLNAKDTEQIIKWISSDLNSSL